MGGGGWAYGHCRCCPGLLGQPLLNIHSSVGIAQAVQAANCLLDSSGISPANSNTAAFSPELIRLYHRRPEKAE